jgi:hypothetical protein
MPVQNRLAQVSMVKQTVKGTPVTPGVYQFGVLSGPPSGAEVTEGDIPLSWATRTLEGHDRLSVVPGMEFETIAMPKTVGAFLLGACGTDTPSGAGPYTHVFTTAADLPYWTVYTTLGASFYRVSDAKIDTLEFSWDRTGALRSKVKFMGTDLTFPVSADAATTPERPSAGLFSGAGGLFQWDAGNAVIKSGSIKLSNKIEAVNGSAAVEPVDVFPGLQTVDVSLTIIPDDFLLWRKALTGSTAGTTAQAVPYYGTAEAKFQVVAGTTLDFLFNRMKFKTSLPAVDGGGGPVEIALEGSIATPAVGTQPYTITLINNVPTY